jgi:DNA-binding transcriptional LysR family regulator
MNDVDWNDLRYVLAIVRSQSAAAAARSLGVSHATVMRRIQDLEKKLGTLLFTRHSSGYSPTELGTALGELGLSIEDSLGSTSHQLDAKTTDLAGRIRFTTTDSLALVILPPILASFNESFPQIQIDLVVTNSLLDLDKLDADVSLRICSNPPGNWVGRRLARMDCGVFASGIYLNAHAGKPLADMNWILPCGPLASARPSHWLKKAIDKPNIVLSADSFLVIQKLVEQNIGVAVLPRFIATSGQALEQIEPLPQRYSNEIWLLTLPHTKNVSRIKLFTKHLAEGIKSLKASIEHDLLTAGDFDPHR